MPMYDPTRLEHNITSGNIRIVMDDGTQLPAYWAHPQGTAVYPAIALIHDWWGLTPIMRRFANLMAQTGYYVVVPDLFEGEIAQSALEAMRYVQRLGEDGFRRVDTALSALEHHHMTNEHVAAVGIGMGGSLAYQAAIEREDLEAAVSYYGFPQRFLGHFHESNTPILAVYGTHEQHIKRKIIQRLQDELATTPLSDQHEVLIIEGAAHDFFADEVAEHKREHGRQAWQATVKFLEKHLEQATRKPAKKVY